MVLAVLVVHLLDLVVVEKVEAVLEVLVELMETLEVKEIWVQTMPEVAEEVLDNLDLPHPLETKVAMVDMVKQFFLAILVFQLLMQHPDQPQVDGLLEVEAVLEFHHHYPLEEVKVVQVVVV